MLIFLPFPNEYEKQEILHARGKKLIFLILYTQEY